MYFSDVRGGAIERLEFNGTVPQVVVTTPLQSIGLCIRKKLSSTVKQQIYV